MFIDHTSIRGFTYILIIIDAKTRKLWLFCTPNKHPPISIITFFLIQMSVKNICLQTIRTDEGRELARSTQFCTLLQYEFKINLETTGG